MKGVETMQTDRLNIVKCNRCGQDMPHEDNHGDYLKVNKSWGYFSNKDLQTHTFHLCEACYDDIIKDFIIPVEIKKNNEAI
jgi:uncharacterized C2H2 Zn-finger protein